MLQKLTKLAGHAYWVVVLLFIFGFAYLIWGLRAQRPVEIQSAANTGCLQGRMTFTQEDDSMAELLNQGQTYEAFSDWQDCVKLEPGDIVLYRYSQSGRPVARKVAAVPGDQFELVRNSKKNNWKIKINGSFFESHGQHYSFGSSATHPISIYEAAHKGKLDSKSLIIFSNKIPSSLDSTEFGVVNLADIVGLVSRHQMVMQQGDNK